MPRSTTSIRLPDDLIEALDEGAAALGVTRSQLIVQAVEQALEDRSAWSPRFLKAIGTPRPELEEAVDEMMEAIRERRSRSEAPELWGTCSTPTPCPPWCAATRVAGTPREDVAISQVTAAEIEFGLRHLPASKRVRALEAQWSAIGFELLRLPWSDEVSRRFGERKARLEKAGRRMSDFDLAIAVHALAYGLTLVTADRASERLKLRRENWLA